MSQKKRKVLLDNERLKTLAIVDPLTKVYNRRYILEQLSSAMSLAAKSEVLTSSGQAMRGERMNTG